ncbi:hypothetical protein Clacol_003759 [Clathrus columnatus]|uniref:Uncharacterized protein n=1 Tax=Clathrus columnatus TaxID=1419009 RepID=A0AAV5A938_9AGAM|nr:hypothetical protein Clacol_003759 [Clathrus columnatus]
MSQQMKKNFSLHKGSKILNALGLEGFKEYLALNGLFYLVALKANDIEDIQRRMWENFRLPGEVCLKRQAGREQLYILRFQQTEIK